MREAESSSSSNGRVPDAPPVAFAAAAGRAADTCAERELLDKRLHVRCICLAAALALNDLRARLLAQANAI